MYYVYMLRCADGTLYTGVTTDLQRRLTEHNETARGAKYTRIRRPVTLVFRRRAKNRSRAQEVEHQLRQLSRKEKIQIIRQHRLS